MPIPLNNSTEHIFNEGRVVGLSAYECYVRYHLSEDPGMPAATELEWLASSLGSGSSLIVKLPEFNNPNPYGIVEIPLPAGSSLVACNTIVASFFNGEVELDASGHWATKVTRYSGAFRNDSTKYPGNSTTSNNSLYASSVSQEDMELSAAQISQLREYMNVIDGVIIQPGEWTAAAVGDRPPQQILDPDFGHLDSSQDPPVYVHTEPTLRLVIKGSISNNGPLVLLTGFTSKYIASGLVSTDPSIDPQDGDFLGPSIFPWATKVIFSVTNEYIRYFGTPYFERQIGNTAGYNYTKDASAKLVDNVSILDMETVNPSIYYQNADSDSRVPAAVDAISYVGKGAAVLTTYSKKSIYPPALYAMFVTDTDSVEGQQYLNPLDIVAPGSVKLFKSSGNTSTDIATLKDYQDTYPHTFALLVTSDGELRSLLPNNTLSSPYTLTRSNATISGATDAGIQSMTGLLNPAKPTVLKDAAGNCLLDLAVSNNVQITISFKPNSSMTLTDANSARGDISWSALLYALANDLAIDVLGTRLKNLRQSLQVSMTSGVSAPYIEFGPAGNTLRLYLSRTPPETGDVPVGSIGFGW